jgi:hypothetical protein
MNTAATFCKLLSTVNVEQISDLIAFRARFLNKDAAQADGMVDKLNID